MIKNLPANMYRANLIDFGNAGYLTAKERQNVMNFFISTLDQIHSWDGFYEAYENLSGTTFSGSQASKLKEAIKDIFEQNKSQGALLGKIVTFFLTGQYPPLPPVMANFGRSQAMLNNIFNGLQREAAKNGLQLAEFSFTKSIISDLEKLLAEGTFLVWERADASGNKLYLNIGNLNAVIKYGINYGIEWIKSKFAGTIPLGGQCKNTTDCQGWTTGGRPGVACCNNLCEQKKKDWAGIYYCAQECVGSIAGKKGTCK